MGTTAEHDGVHVEVCQTCGTSHQYPEGYPAELRACPVCTSRQQAVHTEAQRLMAEEGIDYATARERVLATLQVEADDIADGSSEAEV